MIEEGSISGSTPEDVFTPEMINKMSAHLIMKNASRDEAGHPKINMNTVAYAAMGIVEKAASEGKVELSGKEKSDSALQLMPKIIDMIVDAKRMSPDDADKLKTKIKGNVGKVFDAMELISNVAKDPNVIQAFMFIKDTCVKCVNECKKTKSRRKRSYAKTLSRW